MKLKTMIIASCALVSACMQAQVPTTGLLYRWEFNNNLLDGTGNNNNGTWMGAGGVANYVNDRCNNPQSAVHFDGVTDYIQMKFAGPSLDRARSLSFWMRTDNQIAGGQSVVRGIFNYGLYTTGTTGSRWEICHNYGCQGVGVDISYEYFTSKSTCVNDGQWHHIVVTQALGAKLHEAKVYIDGILMPMPSVEPVYPVGMPNCSPTSNTGINATDVIAPNASWKRITIGSVLGSLLPSLPGGVAGRFYEGDLDDFFLYDRVLTPVEVAQLYAEKCELTPCISCDNGDNEPNDYPQERQNNKAQIEALSAQLEMYTGKSAAEIKSETAKAVEISDKNVVTLTQNIPNPFAESTTIAYNLPDGFEHAQIIFLTDKGIAIKAIDLKEKGQHSLTVFASDLSEGIYAYNLVVDGVIVDSKKMIKKQ